MKKAVLLALSLLLCLGWNARGQQPDKEWQPFEQQKDKPSPSGEPLTDDSIVKFVKIGFSDQTIIAMISNRPGKYALGTDDIVALKKSGVSEKVITAMLNKASSGPPPEAVSPTGGTQSSGEAATTNQDKATEEPPLPSIPQEAGLYAPMAEGGWRHIAGRPTSFVRTGSLLASGLTAGIHARRVNTQIAGERAYVTVTGPTPTFYYRVGQTGADQVVPGTLNLILTQMTVHPGRRQFEVDANGVLRSSEGISVRHQTNFDAQEVEPGLYRLRPDPLKPGQYAFFLFVGTQLLGPPDRASRRSPLSGFIYDFQVE